MTRLAQSFRLSLGDKDFRWSEEKHPQLPIIREHDGRICQPLTFYFGYLARTKAELPSSMGKRSYTLREWLAFLWRQSTSIKDGGCDAMMHRFVQAQRDSDVVISEDQIQIKIQRIYEFYLHLPEALRYWEDGTAVEEFVGEPADRRPITTKTTRFKGKAYVRWSGQGHIGGSLPQPSVMTEQDVQAVYQALRKPSSLEKWLNSVEEQDAQKKVLLLAERNWLLASCMARGGLRAAETTEVTCKSLTEALRRENLLSSIESKFGHLANVANISENSEAQDLLLSALKVFEFKRRRMHIYVDIVGKGEKHRQAAFPIDLMRDILVVGVWTARHFQLATGQQKDCSADPDELFLSFNTLKRMLPGSVSDILKAGFQNANLMGSGHELRKYYATNTANRILKRTLDDLGYLTQAVLDTVYDQVASALGHASVTTTTKFYVNLAMVNYTGLEARRQRRKLLTIWEALISQQDHLDAERIRLCGTAIRSIAQAPKNSDLYAILEGALTDPSINPDGMIQFSKAKPNLRLAVSNPA